MPDDPFIDLLLVVSHALDRLRTRYAITGSVASSIHGEPVVSQDVDICLRMNRSQARQLAAHLPDRFYRSSEALIAAARTNGMANLIDMETGLKVDLSVVENSPFFRSVLARRSKIAYQRGGPSFWVVSPEDIVLMKLLWRRESRSQKQLENALSVLRTQRRLDWPYLERWAKRVRLGPDLELLRREAGI